MEDDQESREKWIRVRMGMIAGAMVLGLVAVVGRVYYLQTVKHQKLVDWARDQTSKQVELKASRGHILDRNGVELAVTTDVPSLYARPPQIQKPRREARRLAPHLEAGFDRLVEKLSSERPFVWLERQTTPDSARAVRELEIDGIGEMTEHNRYYPLGARAGQLLGFVGVDGDGLEGLERMLDPKLAGGSYEISGMRDARGRTIFSKRMPNLEKLQGNSVRLTIDERIQRVTERAVRRQVETYDAKGGYGVVMEVDTGEILAMSTTPKFDPNRFQKFDPEDWRLRPVTDTFEPGSIFKPFVLASALQEGTVSLGTKFDCEEGAIRIGGYTVRDSHPHDILNAAEIIKKSSNIGAYKIGQTLGKKGLYEYIRKFGFGSRTGLGIRGEQPGLVWPPDRWAEVTFANVSFGQGLTATPLQLTTALSTIANGGLLLEPRIVSEVTDPSGEVEEQSKPKLVRRVVSESAARRVAKAMSLVTLEEGTGTNAALEDYTVAGKTGTAQKVDPETHEYAPDKWVGSFMGFVPAEEPDIAVLVMIDEPTETHYGGVVAAPAFRRIAKKSLSARGVLPLEEDEEFDRGDADTVEARSEADEDSGDAEKDGEVPPSDGAVESVAVLPAMPVGDAEGAQGESVGVSVPDFRGLTLHAAVRRAVELGVEPRVEGWGTVVAQRPPPGRRLRAGRSISLVLAPNRNLKPVAESPTDGVDRSSTAGR